MKKHIVYDIIGCGAVTKHIHLKAIWALRNLGFKISGCYDVNQNLRKNLSKIIKCKEYASISEIKNSESNALLIATPPSYHYEYIKLGLENYKNIFCEKPFVARYSEAIDVVNFAQHMGLTIAVGHFRRLYPSLIIAREFLEHNRGKLLKIVAMEGFKYGWPAQSDYYIKDPFGGVIYDTGSHLLDMIFFITEPLNLKEYKIKYVKKYPEVEPSHEAEFEVILKYELGDIDLKVRLSRITPLLNVIRMFFDDFEVWIPTGFSKYIVLKYPNKAFIISKNSPQINDWTECFMLEHLIFKNMVYMESNLPESFDNILSAGNFLLLTKLIEDLSFAN